MTTMIAALSFAGMAPAGLADVSELKAAFKNDRGKARVLMLVSPT